MPLDQSISGMRRFADPDERRELVVRLLTAVGSGTPPAVAADYSGISLHTLQRWIKDGARLNALWEAVQSDPDDDRVPSPAEHELMTLHQRIAKQEADAEHSLTNVVWKAAVEDGDAATAMKLLERRWPQRWSSRVEVTGANGGPLEVAEVEDRRTLALEGIARLAEEIEATEAALEAGGGGGEVVHLGADNEGGGEVVDAEVVDETG